ncbi:MAG: response regulator [Aggregatilineales bacterium]
MNWLIAEDEMDIRNLVVTMCTVWGHKPLAFESGQKAWNWLDSVEDGSYTGDLPEFALMDIRMPGYRGDQVAARMRTVGVLKDIPIVLMTAFVLSDDEQRQMREKSGVDAIINKPLPDFVSLKNILDSIIDKKYNG